MYLYTHTYIHVLYIDVYVYIYTYIPFDLFIFTSYINIHIYRYDIWYIYIYIYTYVYVCIYNIYNRDPGARGNRYAASPNARTRVLRRGSVLIVYMTRRSRGVFGVMRRNDLNAPIESFRRCKFAEIFLFVWSAGSPWMLARGSPAGPWEAPGARGMP